MITIAHIFYNQHDMLQVHQLAWDHHPSDAAYYTIVDDASPRPITTSFRRKHLSIVRIVPDIPWNISGARNLAFHTAKTEWVLCADIDHVVTAKALLQIRELKLDNPNKVYTFRRRSEDGYFGVDAIINILMNKKKYFEIGGYDEDFAGHYGREETFFMHCLKYQAIENVRCDDIVLDWYPKRGKTQQLSRDRAFNVALFERKISQLAQGKYRGGSILRFDWGSGGS